MSATFVPQDLRLLGLRNRTVKFLESDSPIPVANRKIIVDNPYNMSYKYQEENMPKMAEHLMDIFSRHTDKKGMVHIPYSWKDRLKPLMNSDRLMWHDSHDKEDVLKAFKKSLKPMIMMASGFQEGVDLRGEEFGFQVITKIMWPSKQDKLNDMLYREDIDRMKWETCRSVIQQAGRICRGPDDHGITYVADGAFGNVKKKRRGLYQQGTKYWPKYFKESLEWV
jgi:Rad3-related DNA helicase